MTERLAREIPLGGTMSEVQGHYVMQLIEAWRTSRLQTIEATHQAKETFNAFLPEGMVQHNMASEL